MDYNRFKNLVPQSLLDAVSEALKGGQKKLDVDGDGKLEKSDFEKLRKHKKHEAGESEAKEKAEDMKEAAKDDEAPFEGPYKKTGERKDEYGNKVKNVAKHLARKAMKANEGYMPTADEPSDSDKKTAEKVRSLLSKEKKLKKEEFEDLEESYEELKRLKGNIERNEKKMKAIPGIHPEKKRLATQIEKDTKKHKEVFNKYWGKNEELELDEEKILIHAPGNKHHGKQANIFHKHDDGRVNVQLRHSGKKGDVSNFTLQPHQFTPLSVKEDVEQIQEISAKTVDSYREKAYAQQPAGDDGSQLYKKRKAGRDMAFKKVTHGAKVMAKEGAEEISELSNKVLKSYIKKASNQAFSKGYSGGAMTVRGDMNRDSEEEKAGEKNVHKAIKRVSGISKAVDKLKTEAATPGVAAGSLPNGEHMCATNIMHKEWKEGTPIPTMHADPDANGLIEWYDVMFEHGIERVMTEDMEILQAESHMHSKKKMKKEETDLDEDIGAQLNDLMRKKNAATSPIARKNIEAQILKLKRQKSKMAEEVDLDEARGRGRPSAASKAEEDEPLALGMQLRKAKSINKPVTFANKETKEVHPSHVTAFNDHMDARRTTQEKAAFQKRAHASHAEFVKAVSEKVPTKAKDTGEIVKYR